MALPGPVSALALVLLGLGSWRAQELLYSPRQVSWEPTAPSEIAAPNPPPPPAADEDWPLAEERVSSDVWLSVPSSLAVLVAVLGVGLGCAVRRREMASPRLEDVPDASTQASGEPTGFEDKYDDVSIPASVLSEVQILNRLDSLSGFEDTYDDASDRDGHDEASVVPNGQTLNRLNSLSTQGSDDAGDRVLDNVRQARLSSGQPASPFNTILARHINVEEELGSGFFGTVWKGFWLQVNQPVALKIFKDNSMMEGFWEAAMLNQLEHANIVQLLGMVVNDRHRPPESWSTELQDCNFPCLAMEYVSGGDLQSYLQRVPKADRARVPHWRNVLLLLCQMAEGLRYIHSKGLLHQDLKMHNVLVSMEGSEPIAKLADFGLGKPIKPSERKLKRSPRLATVVKDKLREGTRTHKAPELFCEKDYDAKADIFSFGITVIEVVTAKSAESDEIYATRTFRNVRIDGQKHQIYLLNVESLKRLVQEELDLEPHANEAVYMLCDKAGECCEEDPGRRPTAAELVKQLDAMKHQL